jgi:prepilin-type N-terminal cleavage/methylation domain-containing protein
MKLKSSNHGRPRAAGFTLVEMLVVIAIIGILASILLPVITRVKKNARIAETRMIMGQIENSVSAYASEYGRLPGSQNALSQGTPDFTFGTFGTTLTPTIQNTGAGYQTNNSEIVAILMDLERFRNGNTTVNLNHVRNPKKIAYLDGKHVTSPDPGIGDDGLYRDPFGNPYIISIDGNADGLTYDAFYRRQAVSQETAGATKGYNGLFNPVNPTGASDDYAARKTVMIWSFGPDKAADNTVNAINGVNQDNVLNWK